MIIPGDTVKTPILETVFVVGSVRTEVVDGKEQAMVYPEGRNNPLDAYPADNLIEFRTVSRP